MNKNNVISLLIVLLATCGICISEVAHAQNNLLGKINFPNSGAEAAQDDFIEGVLFLHNFEYSDAARAFQRAQEIDPDFALAYWGEAKTHNHPIWMQQDRQAAMDVLKKVGPTVEARQSKTPTQREKDYLMSLEVLYGNTPESKGKTKEERDDLYRQTMRELHEKYPDDHEITTFYGLSILGTAHEGRDFKIYMKAAAELFEVWNSNQKHPGAAHYLIHSFDDPIHAPLGLPMAKVYSEIAPAAAHAQHMTSHIFLALGMWNEVVDANIVARRVQQNRQKELDEKTTVCGHYPWWLQYGYLQQGEPEKAEEVLLTCRERVNSRKASDGMYSEIWHFAIMRGHQIIDSENWAAYDKWTTDLPKTSAAGRNYFFTTAYAALKTGNIEDARNSLEKLKQMQPGNGNYEPEKKTIQVKQLEALFLAREGEHDKALVLLREAAKIEAELPVSFGPPTIVKPSYELLGEQLLEMGNIKQALEAFNTQLDRTPKRRPSLQGKNKAENLL